MTTSYKSLNKQPDYIQECIDNHYNVLLRIHPKDEEFNRKNATYITGKLVKNDNEIITNGVCITPDGSKSIKLINIDNTIVEVLNLDEIL